MASSVDPLEVERHAATVIQALFRGHHVRRAFQNSAMAQAPREEPPSRRERMPRHGRHRVEAKELSAVASIRRHLLDLTQEGDDVRGMWYPGLVEVASASGKKRRGRKVVRDGGDDGDGYDSDGARCRRMWEAAAGVEAVLRDGKGMRQMAVGGDFAALVAGNERLFTYGWGQSGQLGQGTREKHKRPYEVLRMGRHFSTYVSKVTCGMAHLMVLTSDGQVFTCGSNEHGQLGYLLGPTNRPTPSDSMRLHRVRLPGKVLDVACGETHSVVALVSMGRVYEWGSWSRGSLSVDVLSDDERPQQETEEQRHMLNARHRLMPLPYPAKMVRCGPRCSFVVTAMHTAHSWGMNTHGLLGIGSPDLQLSCARPQLVNVPEATDVSCGPTHCIALAAKTGQLCGWGSNKFMQLGGDLLPTSDGYIITAPTPLPALEGRRVREAVAGLRQTVVLLEGEACPYGLGRLSLGGDADAPAAALTVLPGEAWGEALAGREEESAAQLHLSIATSRTRSITFFKTDKPSEVVDDGEDEDIEEWAVHGDDSLQQMIDLKWALTLRRYDSRLLPHRVGGADRAPVRRWSTAESASQTTWSVATSRFTARARGRAPDPFPRWGSGPRKDAKPSAFYRSSILSTTGSPTSPLSPRSAVSVRSSKGASNAALRRRRGQAAADAESEGSKEEVMSVQGSRFGDTRPVTRVGSPSTRGNKGSHKKSPWRVVSGAGDLIADNQSHNRGRHDLHNHPEYISRAGCEFKDFVMQELDEASSAAMQGGEDCQTLQHKLVHKAAVSRGGPLRGELEDLDRFLTTVAVVDSRRVEFKDVRPRPGGCKDGPILCQSHNPVRVTRRAWASACCTFENKRNKSGVGGQESPHATGSGKRRGHGAATSSVCSLWKMGHGRGGASRVYGGKRINAAQP